MSINKNDDEETPTAESIHVLVALLIKTFSQVLLVVVRVLSLVAVALGKALAELEGQKGSVPCRPCFGEDSNILEFSEDKKESHSPSTNPPNRETTHQTTTTESQAREAHNENVAHCVGEGLKETGPSIREGLEEVDWEEIKNSTKDGVNQVDWKEVGSSIGEGVKSVDWKGLHKSIKEEVDQVDWKEIKDEFDKEIKEVDWKGVHNSVKEGVKSFKQGVQGVDWSKIGESISDALQASQNGSNSSEGGQEALPPPKNPNYSRSESDTVDSEEDEN